MSDSEDFESAGEEEFQTKDKKSPAKKETDGWDDWGEEDDTEFVSPEKTKEEFDKLKLEDNKKSQVSPESTKEENKIPETKQSETIPSKQEDKVQTPSGGWGWGGMMSSLLSTATESVSTITSHVSSGISTVIENSIGSIPEPEDMARMNAKEKEKGSAATTPTETQQPSNILQNQVLKNIVYGVTGIGSKVINGGLDNLEGLGKKTMNIISEQDSKLVIKNNLMRIEGDKPNLSEVLREAKVKSEEIEKNLKQLQKNSYKKQLHFESLFDSYYGLVHLEALEMLSKQTSLKLQSFIDPLSGKALTELEETLTEVKELCDLGDMESIGDDEDGNYDEKELSGKFAEAVEDLGVTIDFNDILR